MLSQPLLIDRNLSWRAWFKSAGVTLDRDIAGTSFTDTNALMEAAVIGHGIALGRLSFTDRIFWRESWFACPNTACVFLTATMRFTRSLRNPTRRWWLSGTGCSKRPVAPRKAPSKLADSGKKQLQDRRLVRLVVSENQVERGHFSLHRARGY